MVRGSAPSFEKWSPSSFHSDDRGSVEDPSGYLGVGESDLQTDPAGWTKICWAPAFAILCPGFLVKHRGFFSLFLHQPSVPKKTRCFGCLLSEFAVQNLVVLPQKSDIAQVRGVPCGGPTGVPQGSNRGRTGVPRSRQDLLHVHIEHHALLLTFSLAPTAQELVDLGGAEEVGGFFGFPKSLQCLT